MSPVLWLPGEICTQGRVMREWATLRVWPWCMKPAQSDAQHSQHVGGLPTKGAPLRKCWCFSEWNNLLQPEDLCLRVSASSLFICHVLQPLPAAARLQNDVQQPLTRAQSSVMSRCVFAGCLMHFLFEKGLVHTPLQQNRLAEPLDYINNSEASTLALHTSPDGYPQRNVPPLCRQCRAAGGPELMLCADYVCVPDATEA